MKAVYTDLWSSPGDLVTHWFPKGIDFWRQTGETGNIKNTVLVNQTKRCNTVAEETADVLSWQQPFKQFSRN